MDPDLNKYDSEHAVTGHPLMSKAQWEETYRAAWESYYTPAHMETILRRAAATGISFGSLLALLLECSTFVAIEKTHPMQGGVFRVKRRRDRRPGMPLEPAWRFYPKYLWEIVSKHAKLGRRALFLHGLRRAIERHPRRRDYSDQALTPVADNETETLELLTHNEGARRAVERTRKSVKPVPGTALA